MTVPLGKQLKEGSSPHDREITGEKEGFLKVGYSMEFMSITKKFGISLCYSELPG